ncbi:hypothetical protein ACN28I_40320 [Archangium gephyra]|uniref:hypothetical protein n=1 Tax=Archangium gephyra TaxID=48 RepID=UPI003B800F11
MSFPEPGHELGDGTDIGGAEPLALAAQAATDDGERQPRGAAPGLPQPFDARADHRPLRAE